MSFWNLSDGKTTEKSGTMEMGGGDIAPIPAKTQVLGAPEEAKWDSYEGDEYISIRWNVLQPKEFSNRKIFQKIRVMESDPKKADKAKRMLAAIDTNAGGKLLASGEKPTDESLTRCLVNKPMVLMLQVWEIDKERDGTPIPPADVKRGNWISAVSPRKGAVASTTKEEAKPEPVAAPAPAPAEDDFSDDVPF